MEDFHGAGIYYAATQVEAALCEDRPVHIIGAGNSAGQAAMFLSKFSPEVNLVVRGGNLQKSMSSYLSERVEVNPRIRIRLHTELRAIAGTESLEQVTLENTANGEHTVEASSGSFIFIGASPCTDFLGTGIRRDEKNFVLAGTQGRRQRKLAVGACARRVGNDLPWYFRGGGLPLTHDQTRGVCSG